MNRRSFLFTMVGVSVSAGFLGACGDPAAAPLDTGNPADTGTPVVTGNPADSARPPSTVPGGAVEHPTGADDVVLRVRSENGFVPMGVAFARLPTVLISGDGRVFRAGPQIAIYPGPLLPAITVASITETGLQRVLQAARSAGLLSAPVPNYGSDATAQIVDAPETAVVLSAAGATVEHRAYALGIATRPGSDPTSPDSETTPDRRRLYGFVLGAEDLTALAGQGQLGEDRPFDGTEFRLRAQPVTPGTGMSGTGISGTGTPGTGTPGTGTPGIESTITRWPDGTGVRLADASRCAIATGSTVAEVLRTANTESMFSEDGVTYRLDAIQRLPGEGC